MPVLVKTDLPYLLSRILLSYVLTETATGDWLAAPLQADELRTILAAAVCSIATTPFAVARTRILLATDLSPRTTRKDAAAAPPVGGGQGVRECLRELQESEGRGALFAGWRVRLLYNGVLVAALVPLRSLGYYGLRDAVILEFFRK